jgi:hypothetical protein
LRNAQKRHKKQAKRATTAGALFSGHLTGDLPDTRRVQFDFDLLPRPLFATCLYLCIPSLKTAATTSCNCFWGTSFKAFFWMFLGINKGKGRSKIPHTLFFGNNQCRQPFTNATTVVWFVVFVSDGCSKAPTNVSKRF